MTDVGIGLSGLATLIALIAVRVPIGIALIGVSFGGLWVLMGPRVAWGAIGLVPYQFTSSWILSSIPMFLFLGFISYHTNLTRGMFNAARIWMAGLPGGLAIASIFGSAGFAAVSGSSIACSAAMGRIAIPEMMKHKYHPELATGTVAVAGTIGALIPPSIILILYGVMLDPSLAPERDESVTMREKIVALRDTWPLLLIMLGIFGGLFGGVFTPTEAGAVGAFLACIVALVTGEMTWSRFLIAARETLMTTAALLVIAVGASLLTRFLALSGAGDYLSSGILSIAGSPFLLMLGIVCVYLLIGMFLEPIGAMLLTLPIILPVVDASGWSLLWFGIVLTKLLEIGMITPPIGMNVFVIKSVVGNLVSTSAIFRGVLWFLVMDLVLVAILCMFPALVLTLPELLK